MDLVIKQNNNQQENGNSALLDLLYNLTRPDPITGQPAVNAILVGRISVPAAYEDAVNFLNSHFSVEQDNGSDFQIFVLNNNYYIRFADPAVEEVLKSNMGKDEGEGITAAEASATNLGTMFKNNTNIEIFEELKYFLYTNSSFEGCSNLHTVDVGNKNIGPLEFRNCANLEKINGNTAEPGVIIIPEGTTEIGGYIFAGCPKISVVYLPDTLTALGYRCFETKSSIPGTYLTEIHFGIGISRIDANVFFGISNLTKVYIKDLDRWLDVDFKGPISSSHHLYLESNGTSTEITNVDFTGKTNINKYILYGASYITDVTLPTDVTSIEEYAFYNCSNLVIPQLYLPSLTSIGSNAFKGTKVQTITNLGTINTIPASCFKDCSSLSSIVIPSTVTAIGNQAFNGCTNLVISDLNLPNVTTLGTESFRGTKIQTISNLGNITEIPNDCFRQISTLVSIIIPNNVTRIGNNAFKECSGLTTINIPNGVTSIDFGAFSDCSSLTSVTIPSSVTTIGVVAFWNCNSMTSITINAVTPPTLAGYTAFQTTNNCPIYVPASAVSAYQSASQWSTFASRIQAIQE
jgi:hypothetical protein